MTNTNEEVERIVKYFIEEFDNGDGEIFALKVDVRRILNEKLLSFAKVMEKKGAFRFIGIGEVMLEDLGEPTNAFEQGKVAGIKELLKSTSKESASLTNEEKETNT